MKNRKIKFRYFTIVEWEKEQDFLRQEGLKGWRFTKATLLGIYHFERCEPEDVVYQLDYNPDGIAHKEQYVQMFKDCGWEYGLRLGVYPGLFRLQLFPEASFRNDRR